MTSEPESPARASAPGPAPDHVGYSLANVGELLFGCLERAGARTVAEIGAYEGALTRVLLEWAAPRGVEITAVDPLPPQSLRALAEAHPELRLVELTSHEALAERPLADAIVIDGDHNYFTVSEELRLIGERASGAELPLLLFHDVAWPHARRDTYYAPERIPESERQPLAADADIEPGNPGVSEDGGIHYPHAAAREGGPRNGVLTAIEDFAASRGGLRLVVVPAFFGFGALYHREAPWAPAVSELLDPWDRNPLLARLEANRVRQLVAAAKAYRRLEELAGELAFERERRLRQEELLRAMLGSSAFAVGEHLSRLRQRGEPVFSRAQIRAVLGDDR